MTEDLERALREDFAARARGLAVAPDVAERAITTAHRFRRRRRITALTASTAALLLLAVAVLWLPSLVSQSDDRRNTAAPPADPVEFNDIGVDILIDGETGVDIRATDGATVSTGLTDVYDAVGVRRGWVVNGPDTQTGDEVVRYVSAGEESVTYHRSTPDPLSFLVDDTGDQLVVSDPAVAGVAFVYQIGGSADRGDDVTLPDATRAVAAAADQIWVAPDEYEFEGPDVGVGFYPMRTVSMSGEPTFEEDGDPGMPEVNVLGVLEDGFVLAATPHDQAPDTNTCLSVMDPYGPFQENCYANFDVAWPEAVVSTNGEWALVFTRDESRPAGSWTMTQPWVPLDDGGGLLDLAGLQDPAVDAAFRYNGSNEAIVVTAQGDWLRIGPGGQVAPQEVPEGAIRPITSRVR